jgi:peroxiredoxin
MKALAAFIANVTRAASVRNITLALAVTAATSGCTREQVADLILQSAFQGTVECNEAWAPSRTEDRRDDELVAAYESLTAALAELRAARGAPTIDAGQVNALLDRIALSSEFIEKSPQASPHDQQQASESRRIASTLVPGLVRDKDGAGAQQLPRAAEMLASQEASAAKFLDEYLTVPRLSPRALSVLSLHAVMYPECETNVALYTALVDRLASESQPQRAIQVAKAGLRYCDARAGTAGIQQQLARLYEAHPTLPGVPMQFTAPTVDGRELKLRDYRGRVVVVTFWATWCPACRNELPEWKRVYQRWRKSIQPVEFVGISLDDDRPYLRKYLQQQGVTWPQVFISSPAQSRWRNSLAQFYRVDAIPQTFVVDREGMIAASDVDGPAAAERIVDSLLTDVSRVP